MARHKQVRQCFTCKANFAWEKINGSVRQVNYPEGDIHSCSQYDKSTGKRIAPIGDKIADYSSGLDKFNVPQRPEVPNVPSPIEHKTQPEVKAPEVKTQPDSIQVTTETKEVVTTKPVANKPDAGLAIYDLVKPYIAEDFATVRQMITTVNHTVTIKTPEGDKVIEGCHKQQAELLQYLSLGESVMLVGPAGTGKTTAAFNAAQALGLDYFPMSLGPQTSKSDFFGFTDAQGKAVWSVIRQWFVNGGLLLLDEGDACGAGALTYVNAILANGHAAFPADEGKVIVENKHENAYCVMAANTYGQGADRMYVGRNQLDAATLDRFVIMDWGYDTDLEQKIGASQMDYVRYIWKLREVCERLKIRAVFGTRKIIRGTKMLNAGIPLERVKTTVVFGGISTDDKSKLIAGSR